MADIYLIVRIDEDNEFKLSAKVGRSRPTTEYSEEIQEQIQNLADSLIAAVEAVYPTTVKEDDD